MNNSKFDILVIDDEQIVLDAVRKICDFNGLKVDTARDGSEAIKKIEREKYLAVLCDIMMPQIDGFTFLENFKKTNPVTPIIITSGYSTNENAVKALEQGALNFLPKPFTFDELSSIIRSAVNYSRTNKSNNAFHSLYVPCPALYYRLGYVSWIKKDKDGTALIGIVNLAFELLEKPSSVNLLPIDDKIYQGGSFVSIIEEDECESNIICPLTGSIIEVNNKLKDNFNLLGKDPYFEGWVYRIIPADIEFELNHLTPCGSDRL